MSVEVQPRDHARRNRLIAMAAGAITVIAIVLGFAGDVLGLPWHWMRPAAELLLLAELVGLVVLERHQLFEPVHEMVGGTHTLVKEIHAMVGRWAAAAFLEAERSFRRILGYRDLWTLKAILNENQVANGEKAA